MKRTFKNIIFLTLGISLLGVIVYFFAQDGSSAEAISYENKIVELEKDIKTIYEDESEEEVSISLFEKEKPIINKSFDYLANTIELDKEKERLESIEKEWKIINDMVFIKSELLKLYLDGEIIEEEETLPMTFSKTLSNLENVKPVFHEKYQKLYEEYTEGYEQLLKNKEIEALQGELFLEDGQFDPNLSDEDLESYLIEALELGATGIVGSIQMELERRHPVIVEEIEPIEEVEETPNEEDTNNNSNTQNNENIIDNPGNTNYPGSVSPPPSDYNQGPTPVPQSPIPDTSNSDQNETSDPAPVEEDGPISEPEPTPAPDTGLFPNAPAPGEQSEE